MPEKTPPTEPVQAMDGQLLKKLTAAGLTWLRTNQQLVNALNVFPVPDGDTGTNMVLTMQSALDEIANSGERNVDKMARDIAHGALMGARGNSGVILSQIWRGFARGLDEQETMDAALMAQAFAAARDTAYKGVVRPVEGTILTVIKDIARTLENTTTENAMSNLEDLLAVAVEAAAESVEHTPELLAVLKDAGVVDSGGKGLFFILEGMLRFMRKQPLDVAVTTVQPLAAMQLENSLDSIEPGQDYEVIVDFRPTEPLILENFYSDLEEMGTSIQVGEGDGMYRMHIHVPTENRYLPIDYTMSLGTITKVAIENLVAQMDEIEQQTGESKLTLAAVEPGQIAVVVVSPGPGLSRVFASLGAAAIIEGGQTMNPSTQDILDALDPLPTDQIIIFPNNSNIIMAAQAACELTVKKLKVIPTRTIPQGLSAVLCLNPDGDLEQITQEMQKAMQDVVTGEITTATRTVEIDGVQVQEGQHIALLDGKLIFGRSSIEQACLDFLTEAQAQDYELITLFYGGEVNRQQANQITDHIRKAFPDQEVELQEGGQPHYHFILSIE